MAGVWNKKFKKETMFEVEDNAKGPTFRTNEKRP